MKRCSAFIIGLSLLLSFSPLEVSHAQQSSVLIPLDPVCCTKRYQVYGDEQPSFDFNNENCAVAVSIEQQNIQTSVGKEEGLGAAVSGEAIEDLNTGYLSGLETAGKSLGSLFQVMAPQLSEVKRSLKVLAGSLFDTHTSQYHEFMDRLFAESIRSVTQYESSKQLNDELAKYEGECRGNNPKPECVAERALCSQEKYGQVLFYSSGQSLVNDASSSLDVQQLLSAVQARDQALVEEAQQAEQALETAISVYNQFYQSYRLHLSLKELVQNLLKIKNWTASLRTLVGCFPNKFIGVATTKCN